MNSLPYIDFHTHAVVATEAVEILSVHGDKPIPSSHYFTIGYHPWFTSTMLSDADLEYIENTYRYNEKCLAIGECGLDKLKGADVAIQEENFRKQITLAYAIKSPVIIHCVRKYDRIRQLHKQLAATPWVVHGYARHWELAKTLVDDGMCLSIAPHPKMSTGLKETLENIPLKQVFLETDSDRRYTIMERYALFAELRKMKVEDVKAAMWQNATAFFTKALLPT